MESFTEKSKFRIAVLGIGGVGGYFGGKLAAHFADSENVEIIFITRGENEKVIKADGLKIITSDGEVVTKPKLTTGVASEIGAIDLLILCVKTYDLEESILSVRDSVGEHTTILPLLNGVDNTEKIKELMPYAEVWKGCVFIVSRLITPGVVKVDSRVRLLQFGGSGNTDKKSELTEQLFSSAGIDAELSADILKKIWEKFIFISSLATLTSFLDTNVGGIKCKAENKETLLKLIEEVTQLAKTKQINVDENIIGITLDRINNLPDENTTSMHNDFAKGGRTELASLTGYVVNESKALNLSSPVYERLYAELLKRDGIVKFQGQSTSGH